MTLTLASEKWSVEPGPAFLSGPSDSAESLRWEDPHGNLSIWHIVANDSGHHRLRLGSDLMVDVFPDGRVVVGPRAGVPQHTIDHFIADQVVPRLMAHAGSLVIHAGAVRVGDGAILLLGESGRGKSTLAASFDRAGFRLMGDDAMVISLAEGGALARPVYPSLRLLPDSLAALMPDRMPAGPVAHYSLKQRIDVSLDRGDEGDDVPVRMIAMLAEPVADELSLRSVSASEACMGIVESSFSLDPSDIDQARLRLEQASDLAARVPAYELRYPRDFSRLPEVRQAILNQLEASGNA